jgi:nucleoside-diphosphate-sugar epimerase
MRVLVTGGTGFIGRRLVESLAGHHEVWVLGRTPAQAASHVNWIDWDMASPLAAGMLPGRLDSIVHLAQSRDYRLFPESAISIARVNVAATLELLDHARQAGAKRFVFASSGGVYGGSDVPIKEGARVEPPDFYLATKVASETFANAYRSLFDVVNLRLFFVYGRGQGPDRFITRLVRRVLAGEPVILYGRDGIRVNPIHVSDVVGAVAASLALDGSHVVNVAGPDVLTLRRLTELIAERVGREPNFEQRPPEVNKDLVADTGLMNQLLVPARERIHERIGEVCEEAMAAPL